jgi:hypothetical protein
MEEIRDLRKEITTNFRWIGDIVHDVITIIVALFINIPYFEF